MSENPKIGVGGWLALLIIGMTILGPVLAFSRMAKSFDEAVRQFPGLATSVDWRNYEQISWVIFAVTAAMSIFGGYGLWKRHVPESVRFSILALWVSGPVGQLFYILTAMYFFGASAADNMIFPAIQPILTATAWTLYLKKAVRVKNTYYYRLDDYSGGPPTHA